MGEGPVCGAVAAVHLTSLRASKQNQIRKQGVTDTGPCGTPRASTAPVQICVGNLKKNKKTPMTLICSAVQTHKHLVTHIILFLILPTIEPVTIILIVYYITLTSNTVPMQSYDFFLVFHGCQDDFRLKNNNRTVTLIPRVHFDSR